MGKSKQKFPKKLQAKLSKKERHSFKHLRASKTMETYRQCLNRFWRIIKKRPNQITRKDVVKYLQTYNYRNCNTININKSAILFFYNKIKKRNFG